ncbi:MAG: peptidylprolyl isomerase [Anaerolineae bacterium]|nr:peptidylprolyl isomerase [Anaerolineae bacterium]
MAVSKQRTTGGPKGNPSSNKRKFKPRSQREAEINRLTLIIAGIVGGLIILILGGALLVDGVITPNQAVASVNGENISTRDFQARVRFERWRIGQQLAQIASFYPQLLSDTSNPYGQQYQQLASPTLMGQAVLDDMIDTLLIRQYAAANGISVTDAEINEQGYKYFGFEENPVTATLTTTPSITPTPLVSATPSPTATITLTPTLEPITATPTATITATVTAFPTGLPTATPELATRRAEYEKNSQDYIDVAAKAVGFTSADMRQWFADRALREKVMKVIAGEPPTEEEQLNIRHILVKTKEDADDVLKALQNGASFADLAESVSQDTGSAASGGELGWQGKGVYVPEFDDAVWNAKVGDIIGPIDTTANGTQYGFHIIQVIGREVRQLTPDQGLERQNKTFQDWLTKESEAKSTKYSYWINRVPEDPTLTQLGVPLPSELPSSSNQFGF